MTDIDQSQASETKAEDTSGSGFSEGFAERVQDPAGHSKEDAEAGAEASATTGQSAASADDAQAPAEAAADEGSGTKAKAFDPFAGLTPEQTAHFQKLQVSERSNRGRVGALTKKLNGVSRTQAPPAKTEEQSGGDGEAAEGSEDTTASDIEKKLDEVAAEYGDVLGPLPELVKGLRKEIADLKASPTREAVSDDDAEAMAEAYDQLEGKHADYKEIAGDPEFAKWAGNQPKSVQALVQSFDPQEVSLALTLYKAEAGIALKPPGDDEEGDGGTATADKRKRQLEGSRQVASRGAPAAAGVPKDFGSGFRAGAAKA